jgi:predicted phosphodiesterase
MYRRSYSHLIKLQYLSDIHLEFYNKTQIDEFIRQFKVIAPICILAGDIGYPYSSSYQFFLEQMSFKFNKVFLVHGNHEYYQLKENKNKTMLDIIIKTEQIVAGMPNVHFLNNSCYDLASYRFAGTTMWSELSDPKYIINDKHVIHEYSMDKINDLHARAKQFIHDTTEKSILDKQEIIMVTHHLPTLKAIHPKYKRYENYNQCFASECSHLIKPPIRGWIFGHTHTKMQFVENDVLCLANPIGYRYENNPINNETIDI